MSEKTEELIGQTIDELPWPDDIPMPPTDLPYDDGEPMESPWHYGNATLLLSSYVAHRGGRRDDYYIGANMFIYYSAEQARNRDYKGPDVFIVKDVDGTRPRNSWMVWDEGGHYPNVIFELLSPSTEQADLGAKKRIYEQIFRTTEYFCVAPEVERLFGWRLSNGAYNPLEPDEHGRLWSRELELWLGAWQGPFLALEHTWLRLYTAEGDLVLTGEEAERRRAETERRRAETAEQQLAAERQRIAALEAELRRLRGEPPASGE
jgi:Uma2 family endonuclease